MYFIHETQLVLLLSALKTIEFDFTSVNIDKIQKILITLLDNNWNFNKDFGSLFHKIYLELIGHIKSSLFELFYNRNHIATSDDDENNEIK